MKKYVAKSISNCRGFVDYEDMGEFVCANMTEALEQVFVNEEELTDLLNWADHGDRSLADLNINDRSVVMLDGEETVVIVGEKGAKFTKMYNLAKRVLNGDSSSVEEYYKHVLA